MTAKRLNNILETIGNTPVVRINRLAPAGVNLYVKIESFNPMGSVKDRLALGVIEAAEKSGELKPGQTIIEATSGNTGIGLAMVCAQKGYPLVITMAESFSVERRKLMRFLGAKVILTPAAEKASGMVAKADELARHYGWWQSKQFENPANADIHARTTAVEILDAFSDVTLDYWVTGYGTGGTLNGVSRVLKTESPTTRIMVCEPDNAPVLSSGEAQPKAVEGMPIQSHPWFRPHLMQGWSPDFIAPLTEQVVQHETIDGFLAIKGEDALHYCRQLATQEGIFVGISAGATFAGALQVAARAKPGSNILCMLPDTGERYLTTPLFDDISVHMTAEEMALSTSTGGARFDRQASVPASQPVAESLDPETLAQVEQWIKDPSQPVVMFSLEWCEFCWAVRKLFNRLGVPFQTIAVDAACYQQDNKGGKIRAVLKEMTGAPTLPQIFIGGEWLGGCSDVFEVVIRGELPKRLESVGVQLPVVEDFDPYQLLPGWLHPR